MVPMLKHEPKERHRELRNALLDLVTAAAADLPNDEILAVLSYNVGQVVGMLNPEELTLETLMMIVATNIEAGNRDVIAELAPKNLAEMTSVEEASHAE